MNTNTNEHAHVEVIPEIYDDEPLEILDLPESFAPPTLDTTAALLVRQLRLDGYTEGSPSRYAQAIDRQVCRALKCGRCGKRGLDYRPFTRKGSYVAVCSCSCGFGEQF